MHANDAAIARSTMAKASWRLLPLIGLGYLIAYMDRANISFAALQMNVDLGFSASVYGLGAGIFFAGYALLEIPSNLLCARFGPRRWIARIMLTWGLISAGMMFVRTANQFYIMRFALGAAEAGFFPGVMLYLAAWFPSAWRGRAVSRFYVAVPLGTALMGALAGPLLGLKGLFHLAGWQWLFLAEGLPAVVLALVLLVLLPDFPADAAWLAADERAWLNRALATDVAQSGASHSGFVGALLDPLVLGIGAAGALAFACINAVMFSAPKLLSLVTGWSVTTIGLVTAIGGATTAAAMLLIGWNSDRVRERYLHLAAMIGGAAASAAALALLNGPTATVLAYICFVTAGINVGVLASLILADAVHPAARAVSFAALNTIFQVGAFIGPWLWGIAADRTGSFRFGLSIVPFVLAAAVVIVMAMRYRAARAAAVRTGA